MMETSKVFRVGVFGRSLSCEVAEVLGRHSGEEIKPVGSFADSPFKGIRLIDFNSLDEALLLSERVQDAILLSLGKETQEGESRDETFAAFWPYVPGNSKAPFCNLRNAFRDIQNEDIARAFSETEGGVATVGLVPVDGLPKAFRDSAIDLGEIALPGVETLHVASAITSRNAANLKLPIPSFRTPETFSLPQPSSVFVGRKVEQETVESLLNTANVLQITGTGGLGKTRLALRVSWRLLYDFAGGAWFCDLSRARNKNDLYSAVAYGIRLKLQPGERLSQIVSDLKQKQQVLIVLDNAEQISGECEEFVNSISEKLPLAKILVTSREPLEINGSERMDLAPFPVSSKPAKSQKSDIEGDLHLGPSLALFVSKALSSEVSLSEDKKSLGIIRKVLCKLDGIPLAIELAAHKLSEMTLDELEKGLASRLNLLRAKSSSEPGRWRSLRAALDWSWLRLSANQRLTFIQSACFEDEITPQAALDVIQCGTEDPKEVLESLARSGLMKRDLSEYCGEICYSFLPVVADYAQEKLQEYEEENPGYRERLFRRHCSHFAGMEPDLVSPVRYSAPPQIERFQKDLLAATRRAIQSKDALSAWSCYRLLAGRFLQIGEFRLGMELAEQILEIDREFAGSGELLHIAGMFARDLNAHDEALALLAEARLRHIRSGNKNLEAYALCEAGFVLYATGRFDDALVSYGEAVDIAQKYDFPYVAARAYNFMGYIRSQRGEFDLAASLLEKAMVSFGSKDNPGYPHVLLCLGELYSQMGELRKALEVGQEAVDILVERKDRSNEAYARGLLGCTLCRSRLHDRAWEEYVKAAEIHRASGSSAMAAAMVSNLAMICTFRGDFDTAEQLFRDVWASFGDAAFDSLKVTVVRNYAILNWMTGKFLSTEAKAKESLALAESKKSPYDIGESLALLLLIYVESGNIPDARDMVLKLEALLKEMKLHVNKFLACYSLGWYYHLFGEYRKAEYFYDCAEREAKKYGDFGYEFLAASWGLLEIEEGDRNAALARLEQAISLTREVKAGPESRAGKLISKLKFELEAPE
ncbi:MAG: hypothetical protein Kow00107_07920 [Planctomycetota bacterium]